MNQKQPQQDSFENIEEIAKRAVKQAAKSAGDTVKTAVADAKQQLTGNYQDQLEATPGASGQQQKALTPQQQQTISDQNQQVLKQTRENIEKINSDLKRIRQERAKVEQENRKAGEQEKKQKKLTEEKKKENEPVWKKMLQGKKGTHEASQRVAG